MKNFSISFLICLFFAVLGGLLTGDALENWFAQLQQPWFALPLWGWYVVGIIYYMMVIFILFRLLSKTPKPIRSSAFWLAIGMLAGNEFWNYLFFGLESTLAAFIGLIPFTVLVIVLFAQLRKTDKIAAWILSPYIIWLGYDLLWTFFLWKLNQR